MMDLTMAKGRCANCGKPVSILSTRSRKASFCSRSCASLRRYQTRYVGSMAGPASAPIFDNEGRKPGEKI